MARITHFDISSDEPEKLIPFYQQIFGWKFDKWEGPMEYWMVTTGPEDKPGINGGLGKRQEDNYVVNTIEIDDIDAIIAQIESKGGKILVPKAAVPGVGWFAIFEDPAKNKLSVMQDDTSAK
jgi:predicted enzyme related to lactoylglutathione lyase